MMIGTNSFLKKVRWAKSRISIIIVACLLVVLKPSDPLLPVFIAVSQILLLIIDCRKAKASLTERE
jgi:hypothetical protein